MSREGERGAARGPRATRLRSAILGATALCALASGCANRQLQFSAARQAQTVVDLQYQQVLDNLAMFCLNPSALPSLAILKTGATQVGDSGTLGFLGVAGLNSVFGSSPTVSGTRTVVDQWGSSPLTDDNNLLLVRKAFRSALGYRDLLGEDEANDLAHDLSAQVGTTADMSVDRDTLGTIFNQTNVSNAVARFVPPDPSRRSPPPGTPEAGRLRRAQDDELDKLARRLAEVTGLIDQYITDTLDEDMLVRTYAFNFGDKIEVELVNDDRTVAEITEQGKADTGRLKDRVYVIRKEKGGDVELLFFDQNGHAIYYNKLNQDSPRMRDLKARLADWWPPNDLKPRQRRYILDAAVEIAGLGPSLKEIFEPIEDSSTGLAKETIHRINDAQKALDEIRPGWFRCGARRPKDACYVGRAYFCGQECYVWVCRDGLEDLEEFTRKVLKLGTTLKDVQVVTAPSGIQFSPALTNTGR